MSTAVATQQPSQSLGSPRQQDRKALVSSDGKNGNVLFQFSSGAYMDLYWHATSSCQVPFLASSLLRHFINT